MPVLITEEFQSVVVLVFLAAILWFARESLVALAVPFVVSNLFKGWISENIPLFAEYDYTVAVSAIAMAAALLAALRRPVLRLSPPWGLWVGFAGLLLALYASTPMYYGWAVRQYLQLFGFGGVALVVPMALIRTPRDLSVLWKATVFTGVLVAVTSLFSPTTYGESRGAFLSGADSIGVARVCASAILVVAALSPHAQRIGGPRTRILSIAAVIIAVSGLVYSGSRGPFLHTIVAIAVLGWARRDPVPRKTIVFAMIVASFLAVWYLFPESPGLQRIASLQEFEDIGKDPSIGYRFEAWDYILEWWNRGLFIGHGVGVLEYREGIQPHSLSLDILYSGGLLGFLSYLAMVAAVFVSWVRRARFDAADPAEWLALPAFILAVFAAIASMTGYEISSARAVFFWFATSVAATRVMRRVASRAYESPANREILRPAAAGPVFGAIHANSFDQSLRGP